MEGVASADDVDRCLRLGTGMKLGPLKLADSIGLDTCLSIMKVRGGLAVVVGWRRGGTCRCAWELDDSSGLSIIKVRGAEQCLQPGLHAAQRRLQCRCSLERLTAVLGSLRNLAIMQGDLARRLLQTDFLAPFAGQRSLCHVSCAAALSPGAAPEPGRQQVPALPAAGAVRGRRVAGRQDGCAAIRRAAPHHALLGRAAPACAASKRQRVCPRARPVSGNTIGLEGQRCRCRARARVVRRAGKGVFHYPREDARPDSLDMEKLISQAHAHHHHLGMGGGGPGPGHDGGASPPQLRTLPPPPLPQELQRASSSSMPAL